MRVQLMMALRYLRGRKLRSALTTMAVVFGVAVLFGMNSLLPTLTQASARPCWRPPARWTSSSPV